MHFDATVRRIFFLSNTADSGEAFIPEISILATSIGVAEEFVVGIINPECGSELVGLDNLDERVIKSELYSAVMLSVPYSTRQR